MPNGKRSETHGCDLFQIRDGKIHVKNTMRKQVMG